jgi:hypothetical protein
MKETINHLQNNNNHCQNCQPALTRIALMNKHGKFFLIRENTPENRQELMQSAQVVENLKQTHEALKQNWGTYQFVEIYWSVKNQSYELHQKTSVEVKAK